MTYYGFGDGTSWEIDDLNCIDFIDFDAFKPIQIPAGLTDEKEILAAYFKESKIREYEKNIREQLKAMLCEDIVSDHIIRCWAEKACRDEVEPKIEINFNVPTNQDGANFDNI